MLSVKLRHLQAWTEARSKAALHYDDLLAGTGIGRPAGVGGRDHVWHVYAIRTRERDRVRQGLGECGIGTGIHYPVAVHMQPAYADLGYGPGSFPVSESFAAETLSLPLFPELTRGQIELVCRRLRDVCGAEGGYVDAA